MRKVSAVGSVVVVVVVVVPTSHGNEAWGLLLGVALMRTLP
jgi:hypothetical protein